MKAHDGMFLDGSWRPALGSGTIEVTNPADSTVLGAVPATTSACRARCRSHVSR